MEPVSRRTFFKQAGVTAAAVGAVAAIPGGMAGLAAPAAGASTARLEVATSLGGDEPESTGAVVAQVRDAAAGKITVFSGEHEVTITDHQLAARLVRAGLRH